MRQRIAVRSRLCVKVRSLLLALLGELALVAAPGGCVSATVHSDVAAWPSQQEIPLAPGERVAFRFRACSESIRVSRLDEGGGPLRVERWIQGDPGPLPDLMIYRTHAWTTQSLERVDRWIVTNQGHGPAVLLLEGTAADLLLEMVREVP